jgi:hypothetical protein
MVAVLGKAAPSATKNNWEIAVKRLLGTSDVQ